MALWNWFKKNQNEVENQLNENVPEEKEDTSTGQTIATMPTYTEKNGNERHKVGDKYFSFDREGNKIEMTVQEIIPMENGSYAVRSTGVRVDG